MLYNDRMTISMNNEVHFNALLNILAKGLTTMFPLMVDLVS